MKKKQIIQIIVGTSITALFLMYILVWGQRGGIVGDAQVDVIMKADVDHGTARMVRAKADLYIEGRDLISNYTVYSLTSLKREDGTWMPVNAPCLVQEHGSTSCTVDNDILARFELSKTPNLQR